MPGMSNMTESKQREEKPESRNKPGRNRDILSTKNVIEKVFRCELERSGESSYRREPMRNPPHRHHHHHHH